MAQMKIKCIYIKKKHISFICVSIFFLFFFFISAQEKEENNKKT